MADKKMFLDTNILLDEPFDDRVFNLATSKKLDELIKDGYIFVLNSLSINNIWAYRG